MDETKDSHQKTIVVHSSTFHADDSLAVYFLHNTSEFEGAQVIRTRDQSIIDKADVVCDVGGVYNHELRRYDHHQLNFDVTFPDSLIPCASCGLVYIHFGREIITNILKRSGRDPGPYLELLYETMYKSFVKEVDGFDNGVSPYASSPYYRIETHISNRIQHLNPLWNDPNPDPDGQFQKAVSLIGNEFESFLLHYFDNNIPAISITEEAYNSRFDIDNSGQIICLKKACPFEKTLKDLEDKDEKEAVELKKVPPKKVFYAISPRDNTSWNCKAVKSGRGFELRKPFPCCGLRDQELSDACGIPGGIFVHKSGFLAVFSTKENALAFAKYSLNHETINNS